MESSSFSVKSADASSGFLLWQVTTLWQREIKKALLSLEISHSAFVILASLLWFKEQKKEVTQTTVIEHTKPDKMTVSKSLRMLAGQGFVDRFEHETDTRAKTIILSESGEGLAIKAVGVVESVDREFFAKLSDDERSVLNGLFVKLR
jgi:MarR family transcriptional regulator, organic hydroperoxide resistance regulator